MSICVPERDLLSERYSAIPPWELGALNRTEVTKQVLVSGGVQPWVWASSGSWWQTGEPGVLQSMGCKELDRTEQLNWTEVQPPPISQWTLELSLQHRFSPNTGQESKACNPYQSFTEYIVYLQGSSLRSDFNYPEAKLRSYWRIYKCELWATLVTIEGHEQRIPMDVVRGHHYMSHLYSLENSFLHELMLITNIYLIINHDFLDYILLFIIFYCLEWIIRNHKKFGRCT